MTQIFSNISCSVRTPIGGFGFCFLQNTAHGSNIFMHREVLGRHNISLKTFATVNTLTVDLQQQDDGRLRVIIIHSLDGKPVNVREKSPSFPAPKAKALAIATVGEKYLGEVISLYKRFGFLQIVGQEGIENVFMAFTDYPVSIGLPDISDRLEFEVVSDPIRSNSVRARIIGWPCTRKKVDSKGDYIIVKVVCQRTGRSHFEIRLSGIDGEQQGDRLFTLAQARDKIGKTPPVIVIEPKPTNVAGNGPKKGPSTPVQVHGSGQPKKQKEKQKKAA